MIKSDSEQYTEDEMKIITELQKNCKENIGKIAKNCHFSRQKTWRIIKQLEQNKKIWGYSVVTGEKPKLQKFILFFRRSREPHKPQDIMEIVETRLDSMKKEIGVLVQSSYFLHSEYDWITIFEAENIMKAKKFAETIMRKFPTTQDIKLGQILFTVREQYIQNPDIKNMKEFL